MKAKKASATQLAWAAGLLDGEGCISIGMMKGKKFGKKCISDRYRLIVKVTMCHEETTIKLWNIFQDGTVHGLQPKAGPKDGRKLKYTKAFTWHCNMTAATRVLRLTLPYLVTKRVEALVALEFVAIENAERGGSKVVPVSIQRKRHDCFVRLRNLKTRTKFRTRATPTMYEE